MNNYFIVNYQLILINNIILNIIFYILNIIFLFFILNFLKLEKFKTLSQLFYLNNIVIFKILLILIFLNFSGIPPLNIFFGKFLLFFNLFLKLKYTYILFFFYI